MYGLTISVPWDEDGMNTIVDIWWGRFTKDKARWIALAMTLILIINLDTRKRLPESFTPLFQSRTDNCLVVGSMGKKEIPSNHNADINER
jgi:hypothetical protein